MTNHPPRLLCWALGLLAGPGLAGVATAPSAGAAGAAGVARAARAAAAAPAARHADALATQESELRIALAATPAIVQRDGEQLTLRCPLRLAFEADRAQLLAAAQPMLDALAHSLRAHERTTLEIAVYTDAIGNSDYNELVAETRAATVGAYLRSRGVPPARFIVRGMGESAPLSAENTPEGRDLNRRLELTIRALSS